MGHECSVWAVPQVWQLHSQSQVNIEIDRLPAVLCWLLARRPPLHILALIEAQGDTLLQRPREVFEGCCDPSGARMHHICCTQGPC